MTTITLKQLQEIDAVMATLYTQNPELKNAKIGMAYTNMFKKHFQKAFDELTEAINNVRIDNALSDEKTLAVMTDSENPRGFKYSKDGLKKVIQDEAKVAKEFQEKYYEYEPVVVTELPELTDYQKEVLTGVII